MAGKDLLALEEAALDAGCEKPEKKDRREDRQQDRREQSGRTLRRLLPPPQGKQKQDQVPGFVVP